MDNVKTIAKWTGPAVALLAVYGAAWGVPSLAVAALLVGGGVVLSWGVPKLVVLVKNKVG